MYKKTRFLATAAIIAAIYCAVTVLLAPISYGPVQFRVSEILTVLPFFTPAAIPGLFIGCLISNIFSPNGFWDIIIGSLASLIAAYLSRKMPNKYLVPLPPIIINGVFIGFLLSFELNWPLIPTMLSVAAGEAGVCYILGLPFLLLLDKYKNKIFL
jgi:uncharacterized membrane protein